MQKKVLFFVVLGVLSVIVSAWGAKEMIKLPPVKTTGKISVEEAISQRRSKRNFNREPLSQEELSQILWAAQGISDKRGFRTAPSAGATFPLTLYVVIGEVSGVPAGIYRYHPQGHFLEIISPGDVRSELASSALGQNMIAVAPVDIIITAKYSRTTRRYGERGVRYVHIETGHSGQNIYLECESLGLGTCAVGAFDDRGVKELLNIAEEPLYIMPVGIPE